MDEISWCEVSDNGLVAGMFGPRSFRLSDLELLGGSDLNNRLAAVQQRKPQQYASYGDGIFPVNSHTIGKHIGKTTSQERHENAVMSKIRIANEWDYGGFYMLNTKLRKKYKAKCSRTKRSCRDTKDFTSDEHINFSFTKPASNFTCNLASYTLLSLRKRISALPVIAGNISG